jgi:CRISPR-associated protein Cas2
MSEIKILVVYDVSQAEGGIRRLNEVAKICKKYGQRIQNSVFECAVTEELFAILEYELSIVVNHDHDSLRIYRIFDSNSYNRFMGIERHHPYDQPFIF